MLTIDRLFNGVVLVAPLLVGALLTGVIFAGEEGSPLPITVFQLAFICSFMLLVAKKVIDGEVEIHIYGLESYYLLFLCLIFLSITYTPDREEALLIAFRFIALLIMTYVVFNTIDTPSQLKWVCIIAVVTALAIATYNLLAIYINPQIAAFNFASQGGKLVRSSGGELDPNIFASNYFLPLMLLITLFCKSDTFKIRMLIFVCIGVIVGSVLLTYSRSSWVSIFFGAVCVMYFTKDFRLVIYMGIAFMIAFSISGAVQQLTFSFLERLVDIFAGSSDDSSKFRILLAVTAIYMIFDSYLLGVGFRGFSTEFKSYHPPETTQGIFEPHNEYYAVFAELGLIGFVIFIALLAKIFRTAIQSIRESDSESDMHVISIALFATFVSYLVFYNFLGGMLVNSILFILIGLIFVVNKLIADKTTNTQKVIDSL
ncbi:O-antigen ligase family protein [Gracilimonas sp. BCB1]|uniref:O-antigen ligase family protein n=1 Tax=Gracilimonas sp. BCB1 TaxID=3152362 RepID=UPI0032D916DF